jgi:hypothetical protein
MPQPKETTVSPLPSSPQAAKATKPFTESSITYVAVDPSHQSFTNSQQATCTHLLSKAPHSQPKPWQHPNSPPSQTHGLTAASNHHHHLQSPVVGFPHFLAAITTSPKLLPAPIN